jgi:hypothetical protein
MLKLHKITLYVNCLLSNYGIMRSWMEGQQWSMRAKIGVCYTDDLILIFGGHSLGEMALSVLCDSPWVTVPLPNLTPKQNQRHTLLWESTTGSSKLLPFIVVTARCEPNLKSLTEYMSRGRIWLLLKVTFIFFVQQSRLTWCMHWRKENRDGLQKAPVCRDNLEDVWHLAFHSTAVYDILKHRFDPYLYILKH